MKHRGGKGPRKKAWSKRRMPDSLENPVTGLGIRPPRSLVCAKKKKNEKEKKKPLKIRSK